MLPLAAVAVGIAGSLHGLLYPPPILRGPASVVDGDTLRLAGGRVRLLGIDAPELAQTCDDATHAATWACGSAARRALVQRIAGRDVACQPTGRDVYGRWLAACTTEGDDLGREMIVDGMAVSDGRYQAEEADARRAGRGIWAGGLMLPAEWRRTHGEGKGGAGFGWLLGWFR